MNKEIISQLMFNGKISTSEKILLKSVKSMQKVLIKNHKKLIKIALINLVSLVKVKQLKQRRSQSKEFPFIVNKKVRSRRLQVQLLLNVQFFKTIDNVNIFFL